MEHPHPPDPNRNPPIHCTQSAIHISPRILSDLPENLEEADDDFEENQALEQSNMLKQAGEMLAQINIKKGKEAEWKKHQAESGKQRDLSTSLTADQHLAKEEVDLTAIMRSLQITIPKDIELGYQGEEIQKPEESSPFKLLIKVASSVGTPRNIPLKVLNDTMSSAWGGNYWVIEQIKPAMYVAYFRNEDAMDFVLKRQPWSVESDNLLFEWINPKDADRDVEDYHFRFIYVPIRVYGVPERFRTPSLMRFVIDNIAQPSDLHPPPEITMTVRKDYIQAYARMEIQKPVKDKVKCYISPKEYILFYLNYDKVKRICIFCGLMFHSVQNCPNRTKLIRHLQSINVSTSSVPFSNIGIWTSQAKKIPVEAFQQSNIVGGLAPEFRRDFKMERAAKANQLSLSRFKISDKNEDRNTATEKLGLTSNQAKAQLTLESTSFFGDPLFAQPEFNQAAFFKHKSVIDPTPQQRLKRHAEPEEFPIQEEMQNAEMRTEHPLAADLSKVYCPPHKRKQQVPENSDIFQKSSQTLEQQHQCSFRFAGGTSQPPPCSRKKLRTYKRHRCNEKIQYVQASTSDLIPKENQFWKPLATSLANSLDKSVNVTHQVQNQLNKDPGNNRETLYMEENEENSQKEEQAAAPAFKAPRAQ